MKRMGRRIMSFALSLLLLVGTLPALTETAEHGPGEAVIVEVNEGKAITVSFNTNGGNGIDDAKVTLRRGDTVYKTLEHSSSAEAGVYSVSGVPDGDYSIVVEKGGKTVTALLSIAGAAPAQTIVAVPTEDLSSVVDVMENTPAVAVGGLNSVMSNMNVVSAPTSGQSVEVRLTVESKADVTEAKSAESAGVSELEYSGQVAVKEEAQKTTGSDTVVEFLDMGIIQTVTEKNNNNAVETAIRDTKNTVLEIVLPYVTSGKKDFGVYRYHSEDGTIAAGKTTTKSFDRLSARPSKGDANYADGKFYQGSGFIVIYASKFSTYAIGYTEDAPNSGGKKSSTGSKVVAVVDNTEPEETVEETHKVADPKETGVAEWLETEDHIAYLSGYPNGTVSPQGNITRAEVVQMFYRLLKEEYKVEANIDPSVATLPLDFTDSKAESNTADENEPLSEAESRDLERSEAEGSSYSSTFTDVPDTAWYSKAVRTLASLGIIEGRDDGLFYPADYIGRAEFAAIATRFAKEVNGKPNFSDVPSGFWAEENIATAYEYGWIEGYEDRSFRPRGYITRAEAATIVNHMLARTADRNYQGTLKSFSDLKDKTAWYYYEIVEAANEHEYTVESGKEVWK